MRFREHVVGAPVQQMKDKAELVAFLKAQFAPWPDLDHIPVEKVKTEPYILTDTRGAAGWKGKVYLVTVPEYGVVGYADQPI